jgi:hypothetical protein
VGARSEAILACRGGRPITLTLGVSQSGRVSFARGNIATQEEEECITRALASVEVAGLDAAVEVRVELPPSDLGGGPAQSEAQVEAWVRQALDMRGREILSCVERPTVAVRAVLHVDGRISITLRGDLESTPEEGCVRAALSDFRLPAGGRERTIIHVVRPPPPRPADSPAQTL